MRSTLLSSRSSPVVMLSLNFVRVYHANPLLFLGITGQRACFAKFWHFIIQSIHIPVLIICVGRFSKIHWPGVYNNENLFMTVYVVGFYHIFSPRFANEVMRNMTYKFTGMRFRCFTFLLPFICSYLECRMWRKLERSVK